MNIILTESYPCQLILKGIREKQLNASHAYKQRVYSLYK